MGPASLTEFPVSISAIQDIAQAAAVAEHQHWNHIQRVRKAKFGSQAFSSLLQYFWPDPHAPCQNLSPLHHHSMSYFTPPILLWSQIQAATARVQCVMEWNLSLDTGRGQGMSGLKHLHGTDHAQLCSSSHTFLVIGSKCHKFLSFLWI